MQVEDCYQLGYITKTHGLQGEVNVLLDVDFPEHYKQLESVFLALPDAKNLVPFFIEYIHLTPQQTIVKFEDTDTLEQAEPLLKALLYLPLNILPTLEEDQFYYHEIIGFTVQDEQEGTLGIVKDVYAASSQDLILMVYKEQEVLIPLHDEIVRGVDKTKKTLFTHLPEGLLDVYL